MKSALLGFAAVAAAVGFGALPAGAQEPMSFGASAAAGPSGHMDSRFADRRSSPDCFGGRHRDRSRHHRRDPRCRTDVVLDSYGGEWALYNNRTWESDSYNDWWHDRPDRAFPRWVRHNRNCEQMWWSGGGWRC